MDTAPKDEIAAQHVGDRVRKKMRQVPYTSTNSRTGNMLEEIALDTITQGNDDGSGGGQCANGPSDETPLTKD